MYATKLCCNLRRWVTSYRVRKHFTDVSVVYSSDCFLCREVIDIHWKGAPPCLILAETNLSGAIYGHFNKSYWPYQHDCEGEIRTPNSQLLSLSSVYCQSRVWCTGTIAGTIHYTNISTAINCGLVFLLFWINCVSEKSTIWAKTGDDVNRISHVLPEQTPRLCQYCFANRRALMWTLKCT